ncbi:MAG: thiamine diphosphokinase [Chloroflexi bacterium]|nr:thiamine diphosphokinase [Chloroflexota bacterium]
MCQSKRIVIFANGELPDLEKARGLLRADDTILCADGGTHHALALGLQPNLVVGDMDSLSKDAWKKLEQANIQIELHPRDKDETDLELAIRRAIEMNPDSILIIGALGGRVDQILGNIALFSNARLASIDCRFDDGAEEISFCRKQVEIRGRSGDIVSLIPWNGAAHGVRTEGLKWSLRGETLYPEKTRGISNEMVDTKASVSIESGLLLVIHQRK